MKSESEHTSHPGPQPKQDVHVDQKPPEVPDRVKASSAPLPSGSNRMGRIRRAQHSVWFVCTAIQVIILFRFTLLMGGADPQVGFANFVYSVSYPLVAPFLALFGREQSYGASIFEFSDLVAAGTYFVIAFGLSRLISLVMSPNDPTGNAYT